MGAIASITTGHRGGKFDYGGKFYADKEGQALLERNPHATLTHKVRLYASDPEDAEGRFTIPLSKHEYEELQARLSFECAVLGYPRVTFMAHADDIYCAYAKGYTKPMVEVKKEPTSAFMQLVYEDTPSLAPAPAAPAPAATPAPAETPAQGGSFFGSWW